MCINTNVDWARREDVHAQLKARNTGSRPFPDLEKAVQDDVASFQNYRLIAEGVSISGWVYEVETGRVKRG